MANWALLQEQLVDRPVKKRAKYGIHFDNGDGTVTAHFSGKPCHYEDINGIWQPIDTKLQLAKDGFYGCPHSDVRVHKDGRVKVLNSDYSQFVELPSAKAGMLDGDRIVREFRGGRQYLYITENGFRQEIVVDKPTFPLEKFIAKSSGKLPAKYKESPLTATDANGESYTYSSNVKEFGDWLDRAVYPVTIDPDFTGTSTAGDNTLNSIYPTRNLGGLTSVDFTRINSKGLFRFDMSSVASGVTVTAADLKLTKTNAPGASGNNTLTFYSIASANGDWIGGTSTSGNAAEDESCWNAKAADGSGGVKTAWAGSAGCGTSGTDYEETALASLVNNRADDQYTQYTFTFNASGLTRIAGWAGATNTNYGLIGITTGSYGGSQMGSSEHATASYRPVLTVTYSAGGIPKHFLHYARLRSN